MKTPIAFILALLAAALVSASDLTLKDGRVWTGATIIKQDPTTVTVRHSGGFTQVEKTKLPDELAAQYPIDTTAAEAQRAAELARVEQLKRDQTHRAASLKDAAEHRMVATQKTPEFRRVQAIRSAVGQYLQKHFGRAKRTTAKSWSFGIPYYKLDDPVPVAGAIDRWTVAGAVEPVAGQPAQSVEATVAQFGDTYKVIQVDIR